MERMIDAIFQIRTKKTEYMNELKELRKQEAELLQDISTFMNERGQTEYILDGVTISLTKHKKKILMNKKAYKDKIKSVLYERGVEPSDEFLGYMLDKTTDLVEEQRVKIKK